MPIHPWRVVLQMQPQPQAPPVVQVQLVVQPQPQEQGAAGTAGWVMGMEQVQVMGFLLLVVDSGSGSAASVNQASTLQWRGKSKGGRAVYRLQPAPPPTPYAGPFDRAIAHNDRLDRCCELHRKLADRGPSEASIAPLAWLTITNQSVAIENPLQKEPAPGYVARCSQQVPPP